ncbi:four-helix bundle copper-binding protein [Rugamonas sp. FT107W]|uniref:Four-helix bundle copper-binding protein n=1 Tax=Duganella vulcania TaxID=2692166 RepID=A0A845HJW7_9BURK|nr:four-helix bundle copper-binding protein [Duganella vulcania]MYN17835.1 four-helix bundle copper-binding protein [Duganella vulcania]
MEITSAMQDCIDACDNCHQACLQTALTHCLEMGGRHVEPNHFRLMLDCAAVCEMSANLQLSGSRFSSRICALCADICHACALSCLELDGMEECVRACEACEHSCHQMQA